MISDEALVEKTLNHGSQHFGTLVKRYADYLFAYGLRLTGGNQGFAEDIAQQSFIRAYKYLGSYQRQYISVNARAEDRFRNWLTGIATNCFKDLVKTEARYQPLDSCPEPAKDPRHESSRDFYDLIKPLSSEERTLFVLRYIYDYQITEIAAFTQLNAGTVKSKISRALSKLRDKNYAQS